MANYREVEMQVHKVKSDVESARTASNSATEQACLRKLIKDVQMMQKQFPNDYKNMLSIASTELNKELPDLQIVITAKGAELTIDKPRTKESSKLTLAGDGTVLMTSTKEGKVVPNPHYPLGTGGPKPSAYVPKR